MFLTFVTDPHQHSYTNPLGELESWITGEKTVPKSHGIVHAEFSCEK